MTSDDLDLRDFPYMPLDVVRLRDSETVVMCSGEEFRAAVLLWCAAWHQVPAASLPNDDRLLANLAGFGRDLKGWKAVREGAMRGFIECLDGRLYHPVIAEKANEAWAKKWDRPDKAEARSEHARKAAHARWGKREGKGEEGKGEEGKGAPSNADSNAQTVPKHVPGNALKGEEGKGEEGKGEEGKGERLEAGADAPRPQKPLGSRLPNDWTPSSSDIEFATSKGLRLYEIEIEATKFRNYWTAKAGKDATKLDWPRTWQNWILNSRGTKNGSLSPHRPNGLGAALANLGQHIDEIDRGEEGREAPPRMLSHG